MLSKSRWLFGYRGSSNVVRTSWVVGTRKTMAHQPCNLRERMNVVRAYLGHSESSPKRPLLGSSTARDCRLSPSCQNHDRLISKVSSANSPFAASKSPGSWAWSRITGCEACTDVAEDKAYIGLSKVSPHSRCLYPHRFFLSARDL